MSFYRTTRRMLNTAKEKATEILGDDGMEQLKSLRDDVRSAGNQAAKVAKEVWDDCDNEVLQNAREFYTGLPKAAQAARESAEVRRAEQTRQRLARREERKKLAKRATIVLVIVVIAALVVFAAALLSARQQAYESPLSSPADPPESNTAVQEYKSIQNDPQRTFFSVGDLVYTSVYFSLNFRK